MNKPNGPPTGATPTGANANAVEAFDPYYTWLGIPPDEQPPNHYRLLGLRKYESNREAISNAADARMAHLKTFQTGKRAPICQKLLTEISAAISILLNDAKRTAYDEQLKKTDTVLPVAVAVPIYPSPQGYPPGAYPAPNGFPPGYAGPPGMPPQGMPPGYPPMPAPPHLPQGYPQPQTFGAPAPAPGFASNPPAKVGPEISTVQGLGRRASRSKAPIGLLVGASVAAVFAIGGLIFALSGKKPQETTQQPSVNHNNTGTNQTNTGANTVTPPVEPVQPPTPEVNPVPMPMPDPPPTPEVPKTPDQVTPDNPPVTDPSTTPNPDPAKGKKKIPKGRARPDSNLQLTYGETTNLIEKLTGAPFSSSGNWTRRGDRIVSSGNPNDVARFEDDFPENYAIKGRFKRNSPTGELWFVLPIAQMTTVLAIDAFEGQYTGFDTIQGESLDQQESRLRFNGKVFDSNEFQELEILVYKNRLSLKVADKSVFDTEVEAGTLGISSSRQLGAPPPKAVTIGTSNGVFEIGSLILAPLMAPGDKPKTVEPARPSFAELAGQEKAKPKLPTGEKVDEIAKAAETALKVKLKAIKTLPEKQAEVFKLAGGATQSLNDEDFVGQLTAAMRGAIEIEDAATALTMIDAIEYRFEFDSAAKKIEALTALSKKEPPLDVRRGMLLIMWDECRKAAEKGSLDHVEAFAKMAALTGAKVKDGTAKKKSDEIKREIEKTRKQYVELFAARDVLKDKPDDGEASTKVGLYELLMFGEVEDGLKHLKNSSDPKVAKAAQLEAGRRGEFDVDNALEVADAWYEAAPGIDAKFKPLAAYKVAFLYDRLIDSNSLSEGALEIATKRREEMKKLAGSVKPEKMARDLSKLLTELTLSARLETMVGHISSPDKSASIMITAPSARMSYLDSLFDRINARNNFNGRVHLEGLVEVKQPSTLSASVRIPRFKQHNCRIIFDGETLDPQGVGPNNNMARKSGIEVKPGLHFISIEFDINSDVNFFEGRVEDVSAGANRGTPLPIFHNSYQEAMIMAAGPQRVFAFGGDN